MSVSRRNFLNTSAGSALVFAMPRGQTSQIHSQTRRADPAAVITLRDPRVKALALQALDAARSAGAVYADVRATYTIHRKFGLSSGGDEDIEIGFSTRALVDGYWGWAAIPMLTATAAFEVGREAVRLAKANAASGLPRWVDWSFGAPATNGDWSTPIIIDPFEVAIQEMNDWVGGIAEYLQNLSISRSRTDGERQSIQTNVSLQFQKQERLFVSTEESVLTQTIYTTSPTVNFVYRGLQGSILNNGAVQGGWESVATRPIFELLQHEMDRLDAELTNPLPLKSIALGRYDIIAPAHVTAALIDATLAPATELDRALGYEANSWGTSYLGPDPFQCLGTAVASPLVTLTAERSTPNALATVRWDDEGIMPEDFVLVNAGALVDYQTTREQVAWLDPWYTKHGKPGRSHGCAAAPSAMDYPMQHTPNLVLHPGKVDTSLEEMVASLEHGLLVRALRIDMDFQCLSGYGLSGDVLEIRRGKPVARAMSNVGLLFRAPEIWKNIQVLGGAASQQWFGGGNSKKGEPTQETNYSIAAVPALIEGVAMIDPTRKA